jgi:hypothetical protein
VCGNPVDQATITTREGVVPNPCPVRVDKRSVPNLPEIRPLKAVQQAIYHTKPPCFIHRRHCRKLNIHHLSYRNVYHESLLLDGKHDLVVLCTQNCRPKP